MKITALFKDFFESEKAGGLILLISTLVSLLLANSVWGDNYQHLWHATIAGILLAFAIPFGNGDEHSPSYRLQHTLHRPVAFFIVPVFALANTGISIPADWVQGLFSNNSLGILLGLVAGKPVGIVLPVILFIALSGRAFPKEFTRMNLAGVGFLAGIGFTMSIFITLLAFDNVTTIVHSKIAILIASLLAGIVGYVLLHISLPATPAPQEMPNT
jgi:NhaA family Na+:H+ antiporter